MKKIVSILLLVCAIGGISLKAQDIQYIPLDATRNGDTIQGPGPGLILFDEGGSSTGGNYHGGYDYHVVIKSTCDSSDSAKTFLTCLIRSLDIACTDTLYIYDGPTTTDPLLYKGNNCYQSSTSSAFFISASNNTRCLCVRFFSAVDSVKPEGFQLGFECKEPCETAIPFIDSIYERTDKYGNILSQHVLGLVPEIYDTIFYYDHFLDSVGNPDSARTDSVIRVDVRSWVPCAFLCQGQGIIFHGHGEYSHATGYYNPSDSTSRFYWSFGTADTLSQINATHPWYTGYKSVDCYDVTLQIYDERECIAMVQPPKIQVRLAQNPIKTIFDLATICNQDSLMVNVGYEVDNGTLTLKEIVFQKLHSKTNNVRTFIPDGPRCEVRCYNAPVTFNEFGNGKRITSAADICSVCVNYEHSFMGDYSLAITCPTYDELVSTSAGKAMLKWKGRSDAPPDQTPPEGTYEGGGMYTGYPYAGNSHGSWDGLQSNECDSIDNPYGVGYNYCFSRNSQYTLVNGEPANSPDPTGCGLGSTGHSSSVTATFDPVPAGFFRAGDTPNTNPDSFTTKDSSDHAGQRNYYLPASDFSDLIGCPMNGTWNIQICDYWGIDNGWVFSWSLDICGVSAGGGCNYQVGIDSVVWRPDTNYDNDFYMGNYRGLIINPKANDTTAAFISSPDTCGEFTIKLSIYDEFQCQWDTLTHIATVCNPLPSLGNDTVLCNAVTMELDATDKYTYMPGVHYLYTWEPYGDSTGIITTRAFTNADHTYIVEVINEDHGIRCTNRDTILVAVNEQPIPNFDPGIYPLEGCEPLTINFTNTTKYGYKYRWVFGDGTYSTLKNPSHSYAAGSYDFKYYVESEKGCKDSLIYTNLINVFPSPKASFSWEPTFPTVLHPSIELKNTTTPDEGENLYFWEIQYDKDNPYSFHTLTDKNPTFEWTAADGQLDVSGTYTVRLVTRTDNYGPSGILTQCGDTVENTILLINDNLQFPTVVTPNGDGINDRFRILNLVEGLAYPINQLDIYDKWGSRIFHEVNIHEDSQFWDPAKTNTPTGTYFYRFSGKGYKGNIEHNGVIEVVR